MDDLRNSCPANTPFWNFFLAFTHFIPTALTLYLFYESWRTREVVYKWGTLGSIVNAIVNYAVINRLRSTMVASPCMGSFDDDAFSVESSMYLFTYFILNRQLYRFRLEDTVVLIGQVWVFGTWIATVTMGVQNILQAVVSSCIGTGVAIAYVIFVHSIYVPHRAWFHSTRVFKLAKTRDTMYGAALGHIQTPEGIDEDILQAHVERKIGEIVGTPTRRRPEPPKPPEPEAEPEFCPAREVGFAL